MKVDIYRTHVDAKLPTKGTPSSAGFDLYALSRKVIHPGETILIQTGLCMSIEEGYEGQIRPRSGLALKEEVGAILGTIDADYRNDVGIIFHNWGPTPFVVEAGMRIAQIVFNKLPAVRLVEVDKLNETARKGGFGSTGV